MRKFHLRFIFIFLLASCSSLSKKKCLSIDWQNRAKSDIESKKNWKLLLATYENQCREYGVAINSDAYKKEVFSSGARLCTNFSNFKKSKWKGVGNRDALAGKLRIHYQSYVKACSPYNITPHSKEYILGHEEGLKKFCTKKEGLRFGTGAGQYQDTCHGKSKKRFLIGYDQGIKQNMIKEIERELRSLKEMDKRVLSKISSVKSEIPKTALIRDNFRPEENVFLVEMKREISDKKNRLESLKVTDPNSSEVQNLSSDINYLNSRLVFLRSDLILKKNNLFKRVNSLRDELNDLEARQQNLKKKKQKLELRMKHLKSIMNL